MKKILLSLIGFTACLLCPVSAVALEGYMEYTPEDSTVTYYYDDLRSSRTGFTYDLPKNLYYYCPGWYNDGYNTLITHVVFDPSFADYRPISTARWFYFLTNLNLNTCDSTRKRSLDSIVCIYVCCRCCICIAFCSYWLT